MKRRVCALVCAVLLCFGLVPAHALTEGDVYFTAVNDILLPLAENAMPVWVGGALYVPATTFDKSSTGSNLGLLYNYNRSAGMLTLYTIDRMLVFDLNRGTVYDQQSGQSLSPRAVTRNARTYLPVDLVCDFFGLEDSYTYTQWGYLVRIKDGNARLNDTRFLDAAGSIMRESMEALMAAQKTTDPAPVTPVDPVRPADGDTPAVPDERQNETQILLAVRCEGGEGLEAIMDALDRRQWHALFLFTPEAIRAQDDLVRRVIGTGHNVGLIGQDAETLAAGNAALAHVARTAATVALIGGENASELAEQGWICWEETAQAVPRAGERASAFAQRVTKSVGTSRRTVNLTLDDSAATAAAIGALLTRLDTQDYTVVAPIEPRL